MMGAWGWTCALALGAGALAVGTVVRPAWRILPAGMALIPGRHGWVLVACLVGGLALWAQQASGVIAVGMGVATAVRLVARMRAQRALARRRAALAHLLGLLVTQLEAGTDPGRAVAQLARHAQEPHAASLIPELRALAATEGAQHTDALLAPIAAVWAASREHGVPLAGLLSQAQARLDAAVRQRSSTAATRAHARLRERLDTDSGLSTIEYAMGTLAAAALAAVLYAVVNSSAVSSAIQNIITDALNNIPG